jgi:hypothetical protein
MENSRDTQHTEHHRLLAAIGEALGHTVPYEESPPPREDAISLSTGHMPPSGEGLQVHGGAVDEKTRRVVWVEERTGTECEGYVPVSIVLRIAGGGQQSKVLRVETYNPYFGCQVGLLRWYGDVILMLYREKHLTILTRVDSPYESQKLLAVGSECVEDRDVIYALGREPGLVESVGLPDLRPMLPLTIPYSGNVCELWSAGDASLRYAIWPTTEETKGSYDDAVDLARAHALQVPLPQGGNRSLPTDTAMFREALVASIAHHAPEGAAELFVDTVAAPFLRSVATVASSYDDIHHPKSLRYLVVYLVRELQRQNNSVADEWLLWLDSVAAACEWITGYPNDVNAYEGALRVARSHLGARAKVLATAIRTGALPYGEYCHLFHNTSWKDDSDSVPSSALYAMTMLASTKPPSL